MSTITTVVPPFTKVPNINDSVNFESDVDTFLNEINARYVAGNSQVSEMNTVASEVNANAITTQTNKNSVDTNKALTETYKNETLGYRNEVLGYTIPTEATYDTATIDSKLNAIAPYSGYMNWKEDNFYFNISSSFLASIADKNQYVKFGDKVVDTYGAELVTNGDFSNGTTGWSIALASTEAADGCLKFTNTSTNGKVYQGLGVGNTSAGNVYKVSFTLKEFNGTSFRVFFSTDGNANGSSLEVYKVGTYEFYAVAQDNSSYITLYNIGASGLYAIIDNVSVREIQTKSATDLIPEVTVLDQSTYGLTTQSSVNAGDYVVVDRKELVTNGTFDNTSNLTQLGNASFLSTGTELKITTTTPYTGCQQIVTGLTVGVKYIVEIEGYNGTATDGNLRESLYGVDIVFDSITKKKYYATFTATTTTATFIYRTKDSVGTAYFDNHSLKLTPDIYRAKIDVPSGTLLTNTTYFEVRDNLPISNQIAFLHTMDATTKAYEGISNEILFNDTLAIETPKAIMLKNGFSEVSKGLYSKGSKWYVFAGYSQLINKGLYHPTFNFAGSKRASDDKFWYDTTVSFTSVADCFNASKLLTTSGNVASGKSGRPDGKYYDVIYEDQFISFNHSELAYKPNSDEKKRIREYEKYRGVESSVEFTQNTFVLYGVSYASGQTKIESASGSTTDRTFYNTGNTVIIKGNSGFYYKGLITNNNTVLLNSEFGNVTSDFTDNNATYYSYFMVIKSSYNSKGTSLTTDLIGSPTNYPTIMKDRLAEGKGVFGINPLLVSDSGNSLIPDGVIDTFKVNSKSNTFYNIIRSTDSGTTWSSVTPTSSYITNALTLTNEPTGNIVLVPYTSQNNPYQATTPKAVSIVEPKVIASNSHSIYKGAIVGNCIGKVQVGNGTNGYESKVLENGEASVRVVEIGIQITVKVGEIILVGVGYTDSGRYYKRLNSDVTFTPTGGTIASSNWQEVPYWSEVITTPTHSPIALDNANSPASKWFEGVCYDDDYEYPFVVMEELAYNTGTSSYDGDDEKFTQLTNGVLTDLNGNTCITKFMVGTPIGRRN